jgi:hypothetical protein
MNEFTTGNDVWLWVQRSIPGGVVGAIIMLIVGWLIAKLLQMVVTGALRRTGLDRRLAPLATRDGTGKPPGDTAATIGKAVYYVVMLFVLIAVFDALGLTLVTAPLTALLAGIFAFLPNLIAALLILLVGWLFARIVSRLVTGVLSAIGVDQQAARFGLSPEQTGQSLSSILGTVVYVLILLPVIAAALDALRLETLTRPISNMINQILAAIPNIAAAALIIFVAYLVGRLAAQLIASLLAGLGFNGWIARLGLMTTPTPGSVTISAPGGATALASQTPAQIAGTLVQAAIVWFAVIQASQILGFAQLTAILTGLLILAGRILLGLVIFAVGLYLARIAADAIKRSGVGQPNLLALLARAAILVLTGAMALRQIGVANEIINLAFGLILGAIAVAAALAFGIGGREVAGRELDRWVQATRSGEAEESARQVEGGPTL